MKRDVALYKAREIVRAFQFATSMRRLDNIRLVPHKRKRGWQIDPYAKRQLKKFRPSFHTAVGSREAKLLKVAVSKKNGETIAFYEVSYVDPASGRYVSSRYIYGMRNGAPRQIAYLGQTYR